MAILAPATVPPASAECTEQVTYDADGNVSPLTCANGGVNSVAWTHYDNSGTELLRLGPYAGPEQVYQAMCHDYADVYRTKQLAEDTEVLAQAYYGWKFAGDNPAQDFETAGCPAPASSPSVSPSP
jgi:hypothetical protein